MNHAEAISTLPIPEQLIRDLGLAPLVHENAIDYLVDELGYRLPTGPRERPAPRADEALGLYADGCSYREIAERMGISLESVKTYLKRARRRMDARTSAHAVARAFRRGILA